MVSPLPECCMWLGSNPAKKLPSSLLQDGQLFIPWLHDGWSHGYSLNAFVTDLCAALQSSPVGSCPPVHPLRLELSQDDPKQLQPSAPTLHTSSGLGKHCGRPALQRSSRFTRYCGLCVTSGRSECGLPPASEVHNVQVQMAKLRVAIHCDRPQERRRVPASRQAAFFSPPRPSCHPTESVSQVIR